VEVRLTQISEQMRELRGMAEQAQYEARQTHEAFEKYRGDSEYRMQALEQKLAAMEAAAAAAPAVPPTGETVVPAEEAPGSSEPASYQREEAAAAPAVTGRDFPNSNAHYSHAFKLLNDKDYGASAASFDQFVKKYPNDPLT